MLLQVVLCLKFPFPFSSTYCSPSRPSSNVTSFARSSPIPPDRISTVLLIALICMIYLYYNNWSISPAGLVCILSRLLPMTCPHMKKRPPVDYLPVCEASLSDTDSLPVLCSFWSWSVCFLMEMDGWLGKGNDTELLLPDRINELYLQQEYGQPKSKYYCYKKL